METLGLCTGGIFWLPIMAMMMSAVDQLQTCPGLWQLKKGSTTCTSARRVRGHHSHPLSLGLDVRCDAQVLLCSMTGDVFPRGPPGNPTVQQQSKAAHLQRFLRPAMQWLVPPQQAVQLALQHGEQELLDGCRHAQCISMAPC